MRTALSISRFVRFFLLPAVAAGCGVTAGWGAAPVQKRVDVPYGEAGGQKLLLDVYVPAANAAGKRAAIILVHGGGWSEGDKSEFREMGEWLAGAGYVAFSINYRLVTENGSHWPAQLDDCQRAVRWVRAHADEFGIDPERVGAIGGSAGAHRGVPGDERDAGQ